MIGLVLAVLAGFAFALSNVFVRRGVHRSGEAFSLLPVFAFMGMVLFGLLLFVSGGAEQLVSLSWLGIGSLAGAGIVHFVLGRIAGYTSIRLIGANRAVPIFTCSILFAVLLGIVFLGEPLTITLVLSVLLIFGGVVFISTSRNSKAEELGMPEGSLVKGLFAALVAALCWGVSPVLIKVGLREVNSPLAATFVSYAAASVVTGILLIHPSNNEKLRRLNRTSLIPIIIAAITVAIAQIVRYTALDYSPISLVEPLVGTNGLFIFPLSFLINRRIEAFNLRIIMGAITMGVGVFLIFWVA